MKLIVTLPAYNEEKNIGAVIRDIHTELKKHNYDYKILVVDDGSKDKTAEISKSEGAVVIKHPMNYGLAESFKTEMKGCLGHNPDVIVHIDADGQYRAEDIPRLVGEVKKGNDLVLGSRFSGKIEYMPLIKRLGNIAFSRVVSNIIRKKLVDTQTGFRAFTKEIAKLPIISTYTYTQEQIIRAAKQKSRIKEIPVYFRKRGKGTKSRLMRNPYHYAKSAWLNLIRIYRDYEPLKFFGWPGLSFILLSIILSLRLLFNFAKRHFPLGYWDEYVPTLILIAILIFGGLQLIFFGLLADMKR